MARTLTVDLGSQVPVYRQIVEGLRNRLVDGTVKPGGLLPPVRQLALDIGVHFNTVAEAYRILADEGWLELRRRRGALVLKRATPAPQPEAHTDFERRLTSLVSEVRAAGLSPASIARRLRAAAEELDP